MCQEAGWSGRLGMGWWGKYVDWLVKMRSWPRMMLMPWYVWEMDRLLMPRVGGDERWM